LFLLLVIVACAPVAIAGEGSAQPATVVPALKRVQVHRVGSKPGTDSDPNQGMSVFAQIEATGLKWSSLVSEVRLRTKEGRVIRVLGSAPEGYADENGDFFMSARAAVWSQRVCWPALTTSIPYETVLDLPAGQKHRVIASFRASCSDLESVSEAEILVPPKLGVERALRLLAIDVFPGSTPPEDASGTGAGRRIAASDEPAPRAKGVTVWAYVEAVGLRGFSVTGRMTLRHESGEPIVSLAAESKTSRPVESRSSTDVVPGQAQILLHFVPYRTLALAPGNHRLVLTYSAECDGLTSSMEEVHAIAVATRR
jgi:hypothetical protein